MAKSTLLEEQEALQKESREMLSRLRLPGRLSVVGRPIPVGSAALELLMQRRLELITIGAELDLKKVSRICSELIGLEGIREVRFRNETGDWNADPMTIPDSYQLVINYEFEKGKDWYIEVCITTDPDNQPSYQQVKRLPALLNPINREVILAIKKNCNEHPEQGNSISDTFIYKAVLEEGVTSVESFEKYRHAEQGR